MRRRYRTVDLPYLEVDARQEIPRLEPQPVVGFGLPIPSIDGSPMNYRHPLRASKPRVPYPHVLRLHVSLPHEHVQ